MQLINNETHVLTFAPVRQISHKDVTLCNKGCTYTQPLDNRLQVKQDTSEKMQLSDIFISNGISSELFKGTYQPAVLKRKNSKVVPQDYLVPLSLKSDNFLLCFAHLQTHVAFM